MSNSKYQIISQPLESPEFISILNVFRNLLQSCIGPRGGLKILITSGGCSIVTTSSTRLLGYLPVNNPICLYISQVIKSQLAVYKDCGLFTGVFISSLLIRTLSQQDVPPPIVVSFIQQISSELSIHLNSIKMKIDFSTVQQLLPIVKSILNSNPACMLSNASVDSLAITIVKAFLNSVDEVVGDIIVICDSGLKYSLHPGILYQTGLFTISKEVLYLFDKADNDNRKLLVLFNIMLSHEKNSDPRPTTERVSVDTDNKEVYNVEKTLQVLKFAVKLGVTIVACQKVVHPILSLYLRRNGVLLLDRMGTELTHYVEKLSGAIPISDIEKVMSKECLVPLLGHINVVRNVQSGKKNFVALERKDKNVETLLIGSINAEATEELKVTVGQALQSLRHLLVEPYVLPGASCMEMSLVAGLEARLMKEHAEVKLRYSTHKIQASLRLFQLSLLSAAGYDGSMLTRLYTDTSYYHAWRYAEGKEWSLCCCGLVTADMIRGEEKAWISLDLNSSKLLSGCEIPKQLPVSKVHDKAIVDLYASKINAFKLSLETFVGLMGIGMVVYKPAI